MKPSDRIWAIANERCIRQGVSPTEVTLPDVANYLDEQRGLIAIVAPEHMSAAGLQKMAENLKPLTERHDIVILPFGSKVISGAPEIVGNCVDGSPTHDLEGKPSCSRCYTPKAQP